MKKSFFLFAFILGLMPSLFAQSADLTAGDIAEKYIEAIGGEEAWRNVKTMTMDMKMNMYGMDFPGKVTMGAPNKFRLDISVQGQKIIQSYDGETAWQVMPMMGITTPTKMSEAEAVAVNQTELLPEFINYEERGYTLELVDAREVEGVATQGVKLSDGKKKNMVYYFDLENFVPIMMSTTIQEGQGKGSVINTYMSGYEEVEGGVILPLSTEVKMDGQTFQKMTADKVSVNAELEEGLFSMPKK